MADIYDRLLASGEGILMGAEGLSFVKKFHPSEIRASMAIGILRFLFEDIATPDRIRDRAERLLFAAESLAHNARYEQIVKVSLSGRVRTIERQAQEEWNEHMTAISDAIRASMHIDGEVNA